MGEPRKAGQTRQRRRQHHQRERASPQIQALYAELQERFPKAFAQDPAAMQPFAVGVYHKIKAAVGDRYNSKVIHWTLQFHTRRRAYLRALIAGKPRVDLEGNVVAELTETERQIAYAELEAKLQGWRQQGKDKTQPTDETKQRAKARRDVR